MGKGISKADYEFISSGHMIGSEVVKLRDARALKRLGYV